MLESELEPEFVSLLEVLRRTDPGVVPGSQQQKALAVPVKLVTGAYLNRMKLPMVQFTCHLRFAPTLGALFCKYDSVELAERLLMEMEHWHTLGLDLKVMQGMVMVFYAELWRPRGVPAAAESPQFAVKGREAKGKAERGNAKVAAR